MPAVKRETGVRNVRSGYDCGAKGASVLVLQRALCYLPPS